MRLGTWFGIEGRHLLSPVAASNCCHSAMKACEQKGGGRRERQKVGTWACRKFAVDLPFLK